MLNIATSMRVVFTWLKCCWGFFLMSWCFSRKICAFHLPDYSASRSSCTFHGVVRAVKSSLYPDLFHLVFVWRRTLRCFLSSCISEGLYLLSDPLVICTWVLYRRLEVLVSQLSSASVHSHLGLLSGFQTTNHSKNTDLIVFFHSSLLSTDALW